MHYYGNKCWGFKKQLNVDLPDDPAILLLGVYLKESISVPHVYHITIHDSQIVESG